MVPDCLDAVLVVTWNDFTAGNASRQQVRKTEVVTVERHHHVFQPRNDKP